MKTVVDAVNDFFERYARPSERDKAAMRMFVEARDAEHRAELERLKGELAEARNIVKECRDMMVIQTKRSTGEFHLSGEAFVPMWSDAITAATKFLAAQPPAAPPCAASAGSCNSPNACGEAGRCIDARMREVVGPAVPGSERSVHRCTGCDWTLNTTAMTEDVTTEHVHEHLRKEHGMEPAPPADIRERWSAIRQRLDHAADRVDDHERRLAALEAKGEPGTFQHYFSNDGKKRCEVCGLPEDRPCHPKGAKP